MPQSFTFNRTDDTKNKVKYVHHEFGTLYVPKNVVKEMGDPMAITVTMTPAT